MNLTVYIQKAAYNQQTVLRDVHFIAETGMFTAVIGRNGSGKSTLLSCIAGLMPFEGRILAGDNDLTTLTRRERARRIAVLLQSPRAPHIPVEDLVAFGRAPYRVVGGVMSDSDREAVERAIVRADLTALRRKTVDTLSGGEMRRAYVAMLLAQDAPICLLDESTAFMDTDYESRVLTMAASLAHDAGKTVLAVMHGLENALTFADRVLLVHDGVLVFYGTPADLLATELPERIFRVRRYTATGPDGTTAVFFRGARELTER